MKTSYSNEHTMSVTVNVDMGELANLIEYTSTAAEADGGSYVAKDLLKSLKRAKQDAAENALRGFQRMIDAE